MAKKNFMTPFYGWGSTASRLVPLRGGSLLFKGEKVLLFFQREFLFPQSQQTFTCSKAAIEIREKVVNYVQI